MCIRDSTGIAFIPSVGPDISWEPADLSIDFAPAQLAFDPQVQEPAARYVPGAVSYTHLVPSALRAGVCA